MIEVKNQGDNHLYEVIFVYETSCTKCDSTLKFNSKDIKSVWGEYDEYEYIKCPVCKHKIILKDFNKTLLGKYKVRKYSLFQRFINLFKTNQIKEIFEEEVPLLGNGEKFLP